MVGFRTNLAVLKSRNSPFLELAKTKRITKNKPTPNQLTNYRCLFRETEPRETNGAGIRARLLRQPLPIPCPSTMAVVAVFDATGENIVEWLFKWSGKRKGHTHDLDHCDSTRRCSGLHQIAEHRMAAMAPNASAKAAFHDMKNSIVSPT